MALVTCKECGTQVASSAKTCPKCGVDYPGGAGQLLLIRRPAMTGAMYSVKVAVDGQPVGEIKNDATLRVALLAGEHRVDIRGGGMSDTAEVKIQDGQQTPYDVSFSAFGILGGGLKLKPSRS